MGLGAYFSQGGNRSCQYSVSSSNLHNWVDGEWAHTLDPVVRKYINSALIPPEEGRKTSWKLGDILAAPRNHQCDFRTNPDIRFFRLVIELGTNPSPNEADNLNAMFYTAHTNGVKEIIFIGPIGPRDNPYGTRGAPSPTTTTASNYKGAIDNAKKRFTDIKFKWIDSLALRKKGDEKRDKEKKDKNYYKAHKDNTVILVWYEDYRIDTDGKRPPHPLKVQEHFRDKSDSQNNWLDAIKNAVNQPN